MELNSWPLFDDEMIDVVINVLRTGKVNYWTGSQNKLFEEEFASYVDSKYAVALSNGTVALTSAYKSLGIGYGDEVITTPRTFIATTSSILSLGAKAVFADISLDSGSITAESIEPLITKKTKAISLVHLAGWPADMVEICKLAKIYNLRIIEDCSQAHGAKIDGQSVGSFGDVSTWSFCQDKIITTGGEGGMVTTNNEDIRDFIWSYKDHGKASDFYSLPKDNAGYRYIHNHLGTNFRMTEMQASIGIVQLSKLQKWNIIRHRNAMILYERLSDLDSIRIPIPREGITHAWYKFYIYLKLNYIKKSWSKDRIIEVLQSLNLPAYYGSCSEIYLEECIINSDSKCNYRLPNARELGQTSLMFLVHPTITVKQMEYYSDRIRFVLKQASIS